MEFIKKTDEIVTITIHKDDLVIMKRALEVSLEVVEDWEYSIRMGVTKEEVKTLLDEFNREFKNHEDNP